MSGTQMSKSFTTITNDVSKATRQLCARKSRRRFRGFNALAKAALSPGVLSALDKELIAPGDRRCQPL
jgi:hypothetical protein